MTDFERRVIFEPGYNYLHETGPKRRGQHGMAIRFLLIGPQGAAQFLMGTSWTPLGEVDKDANGEPLHREPVHIDYWKTEDYGMGPHKFGLVNPPDGYDLGQHWTEPLYNGQDPMECELLPGGQCYYDGSGLNADPILKDFITEGEEAVWRHLEEHYDYCVTEALAYRSGVQA